MKLVATDIFDFNSWYRFNQKTIYEGRLIDYSTIENISNETLLHKIGLFEEENDRFLVELPDSLEPFKVSDYYVIPIDAIQSIIPISEQAKRILENRFPDYKIESPLPNILAKKILDARSEYFSSLGGEMVLKIFGVTSRFDDYESIFLKGLQSYTDGIKPDSLPELVIAYERSRPYPNNDSGFLFDVGNIAKTYFNISDNDLRFKEDLKIEDEEKYKLIEEILSLSVFLQNNDSKDVFGPLIKEISQSKWLKELNTDLSLITGSADTNNLLVIAFYLKFRYLIRNTTNLSDHDFQRQVSHILAHAKKEASIALYLNGLFFGSLKFRELYYETNPLPFSKEIKYLDGLEGESTEEPQTPSHSDHMTMIILSCFEGKDSVELREIKKTIKEKTGNTLGRGFTQLKELLENISDIEVDENSSPISAKKRNSNQSSDPDLFS